jgi:hypothetical protein
VADAVAATGGSSRQRSSRARTTQDPAAAAACGDADGPAQDDGCTVACTAALSLLVNWAACSDQAMRVYRTNVAAADLNGLQITHWWPSSSSI